MKWLNGWTVALGTLGVAALANSRRSGVMTEKRDEIYRDCLSGRVPVDRMRAVADSFEKVRCYPQARMLRLRVALQELSPEEQASMRANFQKGMASKNGPGVLRLAQAFDERGATSSAAKLRRHARALMEATAPTERVVTPDPPPPPAPPLEPADPEEEAPPSSGRSEPTEPAIPIPQSHTLPNGKSHVAVSPEVAAAN